MKYPVTVDISEVDGLQTALNAKANVNNVFAPMPQIKITGLNPDVGHPYQISSLLNRWLYNKPDGTFEEYRGIFVNSATGIGSSTFIAAALSNATAIDMTGIHGFLGITLTGSGASLTAPDLITCGTISCSFSTALTSLSLPNCISITGAINFPSGGALGTISLPKLRYIGASGGGINLSNQPLVVLNLPSLETSASTGAALTITNCAALTTINLPLLKRSINSFCVWLISYQQHHLNR